MKRLLVVVSSAAVLCVTAAVPAWAASDPYRSRQWGLSKIRADRAWSTSKGAGVTIAIVDSGIDLTHPDLKNKIVSHYSCIGGTCKSGGDDDNGHGSHVAGIAAASTSNGLGIAGVAPSAKLMAVKVLGADGTGACGDVDAGIRWAADRGADVINLSLNPGVFGLDIFCGLQSAAEYAWGKGSVVVVAAGNDGLVNLYRSDSLIVVGATGPQDQPAAYSNAGADIYAPGGDRGSGSCTNANCVYSTWKDGKYATSQGTSMAAPHVSGITALLLSRGVSKAQILPRLKTTADHVGGILRVNAARAVGTVAATVKKVSVRSRSRSSGRVPGAASRSTRTRSGVSSVTGEAPLPYTMPPAYALESADGAPSSSHTPARPWVISVAGGLALLSGAGMLRRILAAA